MTTLTPDPLETYTHIPIHLDPSTKTLSLPSTSYPQPTRDALTALNALHTQLKTLETPSQIPPPPVPVAPKRSAQIAKLRDAALASHKKGDFAGAVRLWGYAIDMASGRPGWEPAGLAREELSGLYRGRAESWAAMGRWVEGWKDGEASVECKAGVQVGPQGQKGKGNVGAWVVGGRCLGEMGRWGEVVAWCERGVSMEDVEGEGRELEKMLGGARRREEEGLTRGLR